MDVCVCVCVCKYWTNESVEKQDMLTLDEMRPMQGDGEKKTLLRMLTVVFSVYRPIS